MHIIAFISKSTIVLEDSAQIAKEITRRKNLIPNIIVIVKNYASYERTVFLQTTEGRQALTNVKKLESSIKQLETTKLENAFSRLLAISEQYPMLKADLVFTDLIKNLAECEDRIAAERAKYNSDVNMFNTYRSKFPAIIFAIIFGYKIYGFYEEKADRMLPVIEEFETKVHREDSP